MQGVLQSLLQVPISCLGWYHTDSQPGAWHATVR